MLLCACAVLGPCTLSALDPSRSIGQYIATRWGVRDSFPGGMINAIAQTPDGYLWIGAENGLVRFDGVHCHVLGLKDGLRSLQISALLFDSHGVLWIGTVGGGLSRLEHGQIKTIASADGRWPSGLSVTLSWP